MMRCHREVAPRNFHRGIKTLSVRDRNVLGMPDEYRFYQRLTTNPYKFSGPQFNTHFSSHHRVRDKDALVDYLNWGKEIGQAHMPHRNQRVAFDFHDTLLPTKLPYYAKDVLTANQDPTDATLRASKSFRPVGHEFNQPQHLNMRFTQHLPGQGLTRPGEDTLRRSGVFEVLENTTVMNAKEFGAESAEADPAPIPGIHHPYLGEPDTRNMEAMATSVPDSHNQVCQRVGRFSRHIYLNRSSDSNRLLAGTSKVLNETIDKASHGLRTKAVVLKAAQSGRTDYFCGGINLEQLGHYLRMEEECERNFRHLTSNPSRTKTEDMRAQQLSDEAARYRALVDDALRQANRLLWRVFSAQNNLLTIVNGKCANVGNGLALLSKYSVLRDSSEFSHDGPTWGVTPFGGLTHFLARQETSLKYPGLAEYVMLTGQPLYAGDALRLGWTDLFSTISDLDFHIKSWFDDTEHLHGDAVAWQLNHLLESTSEMKSAHSPSLERVAISQTKSSWIEDAFADQPSVLAIIETLSQMEALPLSSALNPHDAVSVPSGTLKSVSDAVAKLREKKLTFASAPWESDFGESREIHDVFCEYFFSRNDAGVNTVTHRQVEAVAALKAKRDAAMREFAASRMRSSRHVFVRVLGCDNHACDFEFDFNCDPGSDACIAQLKSRLCGALGYSADREVAVFWQLPNLDTCEVHRDTDLVEILSHDPGLEHPTRETKLPPLYFTAARKQYHLSEWAFSVKHQMLLASPFALKASFALLQSVRGGGDELSVCSVSETLSKEFRFLQKLLRRHDFRHVGSSVINLESNETSCDTLFEKNAVIDGHTFKVRPKWQPRTLDEVSDSDIAAIAQDLSFEDHGTTELNVITETNHADRVVDHVFHTIGFELVAGLGEKDSSTAPLTSDVAVPDNVNFYEMARHPFKETPTSWRSHGFTEDSLANFKSQYQEAVRATYDPEGDGAHHYWKREPTMTAASLTQGTDDTLLRDRLWNVVEAAGQSVESWAKDAAAAAQTGSLGYNVEVATSEEKVFDDHYYRWFVRPGQHPNPSGMLRAK